MFDFLLVCLLFSSRNRLIYLETSRGYYHQAIKNNGRDDWRRVSHHHQLVNQQTN